MSFIVNIFSRLKNGAIKICVTAYIFGTVSNIRKKIDEGLKLYNIASIRVQKQTSKQAIKQSYRNRIQTRL